MTCAYGMLVPQSRDQTLGSRVWMTGPAGKSYKPALSTTIRSWQASWPRRLPSKVLCLSYFSVVADQPLSRADSSNPIDYNTPAPLSSTIFIFFSRLLFRRAVLGLEKNLGEEETCHIPPVPTHAQPLLLPASPSRGSIPDDWWTCTDTSLSPKDRRRHYGSVLVCTFCGSGQVCADTYAPLSWQTEQLLRPKVLSALSVRVSLPSIPGNHQFSNQTLLIPKFSPQFHHLISLWFRQVINLPEPWTSSDAQSTLVDLVWWWDNVLKP